MTTRRKLTIGALVILAVYIVWTATRPLSAISATSDLASQPAANAEPQITWSDYGEQAVGVPGYGVLATHGSQGPLPTASVAKVMAALAVLQKKPLKLGEQGPNVPITTDDVALYEHNLAQNQSGVEVRVGEKLSEYQALQALLIPSGNNIATLTTKWAYGSLDNYLTFANQYAKKLGMQHTTFADASGFDPDTKASPADLVLLGEAAMQNPVIAQIVGQSTAKLPVVGEVQNYNSELGNDVGINGIKTGNNDQDLGCLLYSTTFEGSTLVGVIMDAPDLATALKEGSNVAESFKESVQKDKLVANDQVVAHYTLPWGGKVEARAQEDLSVVYWKDSTVPVKLDLTDVKPSDAKGTSVGTASFTYNNTTHSVPVKIVSNVPKPSLWWRITHP